MKWLQKKNSDSGKFTIRNDTIPERKDMSVNENSVWQSTLVLEWVHTYPLKTRKILVKMGQKHGLTWFG